MSNDPFSDPNVVSSTFPSAASFRGRVALFEVQRIERDVPNQDDPSKKADRLTVTVTVLDGKGPVQLFPGGNASGQYVDGPVHEGVWFGQDRVVESLVGPKGPKRVADPGKKVIGILETFKPGQPARKGNPWDITPVTPAQRKAAVAEYATIQLGDVSEPEPPEDNPFE